MVATTSGGYGIVRTQNPLPVIARARSGRGDPDCSRVSLDCRVGLRPSRNDEWWEPECHREAHRAVAIQPGRGESWIAAPACGRLAMTAGASRG